MEGRIPATFARSVAAGAVLVAHLATADVALSQSPPPRSTQKTTAPATPSRSYPVDSEVGRAGFHRDAPSSQQSVEQPPCIPAKPQPSPPAAPPSPQPPTTNYAPPYAPPYAPQYVPAYAPQYAPAYAPQYAPAYAPQYAPVYAPVAPSYAPSPPPPAGNFFLPPSAPPPAGPPPMAPMAPMAPAYMPMAPVMAPQPAPVGAGVALAGSSVSVPATRSSTSVEVRGPGLFNRAAARLGERLTQFGRTRIRTVQETVLETPPTQAAGGTATIATTSLVPMQGPPSAPPAAPPASPPQAPPESPTPSPQGEHCAPKHSLLQHLFGHE